MSAVVHAVYAFIVAQLIRRDTAQRDGISAALWIPTLWVGIIASKPMSAWLGMGGGFDTLEGSPADRLFFLVMIAVAIYTVSRRGVNWSALWAQNWGLVVFYGFLLISVLWTNSPISSLKRWIKEFGNIFVVLVILTELNPLQAIRAVFVRCAYVFIPLSIIYIRYFPELGRRYSRGGAMEATGVTFQKNTLGTMVIVCGLILLWDWLERTRAGHRPLTFIERWLPPVTLGIGGWLLYLSDSKTSIVCFVVAALIITSVRLPALRRRIGMLSWYALLAAACFGALEWVFGISDEVIASLGRDMTFTGRTDVWRELLKLNTDPILGTGFMSFWDDPFYQSKLPPWVAFSAHNGYLEIYLAGGWLGVTALGIMVFASARRCNAALKTGTEFAAVRFAIFVAMLISNFSESNFACMTSIGFLFLLATIGEVPRIYSPQQVHPTPEPTGETLELPARQ